MKMKKILAVMLSFVIVLSGVVVPAYSAESDRIFTDNQIELLQTLDIIQKDYATKYYTNEMTRGAVVYYIRNFAEIDNATASGFEAIFKDVTSEHKYFAAIKALKNAGYINGYENGYFGPDDPMSTKDAAKVILYTLGYKSYINANGVNSAIVKSGIMDGVDVKNTIQIQDLVLMFWNALHAPAFRMTGTTSDGAIYEFDDKYLGLDHLYKVVYAKGVVDGVCGTRLSLPYSGYNDNDISIDSNTFVYNGDDAEELLGYNVDYYYKENGAGRNEIVYISISDRNKVLEMDSADILSFSNFTYKYYVGNNTRTTSISDTTYVIYNGVAFPAYTDAEAVPDFGTVTLIDNNNDNRYEVARIDNYEFYLVNNVDTKNKVFADKTSGVQLDVSKANDLRITWDGDDYPIERIIKGDFLVVRRTPEDSGYYSVRIDVRKDERTASKIETFSIKKNTLTAGGTDYKLWDRLSSKSPESVDNLVLNKFVTLYFCNGVVVRIEQGEGGGAKYGYLVDIHGEGDFGDVKTQFLLVDSTATMAIYDMSTSIKIDGVRKKTFSEISTALAQNDDDAAVRDPHYDASYPYAQPVKYELNDNGQLSAIDTLKTTAVEVGSESALTMHASGSYTMRNQNTSLYNSSTLVASIADSSTKLRIPNSNRGDADGYAVLTWNDNDTMDVTVCNVDSDIWITEAVYGYEDVSESTAISYRTYPVIISDMTTGVDENGDIVYTVDVFSNKTTATYTADPDMMAGVETGDMIHVELNADNKIKKIKLLFDASEDKLVGGNAVTDTTGEWIQLNASSSYGYSPFVMGYKVLHNMAIYVKEGFLRTTWSLPSHDSFDPYNTDRMDNVNYNDAVFFKYSEVRGEPVVETASANDIKTFSLNPANPSELVMLMYSNGLKYVYIIEK